MPGSPDGKLGSSGPVSDAPSRLRWRRWLPRVLRPTVAVLLVVLIARHLLTGIDGVPYHVDEDAYLSASYFYRLFVREGRWRSWYWHRARTHEAPVVSRYAIALGLDLAGEPLETTPSKYETWWASQQHLPTTCERFAPSTLGAGRRIAAVASVGSCALLLLLAWRALGWPTAIAATALLGWNPLLAASGRRAMAEGPLVAFWLLTVLLPVVFFGLLVRRARRGRLQILLVGLFGVLQGVAVGLAAGTKLSAGLTAVATAALLVVLVVGRLVVIAWRERQPKALARAWLADRPTALIVLAGALSAAVSIAVFVAPNPSLYPDPVGRTRVIVRQFGATSGNLQRAFYRDRLETREDALRSAARLTLLGDYVSFPRVWPPGVYAALFLLGFLALVVRVGDGSIYRSDASGDGWQRAARNAEP